MRITTAAAIARSISHGEITRVEHTDEVFTDLVCECSDHVDLPHGCIDFWGTTDAGEEWRVVLTDCPDEDAVG